MKTVNTVNKLPEDKKYLDYYVASKVSPESFPPVEYPITIVSHCTPNHLVYLPNLLKNWQGPVSVAVLVANQSELLLQTIGGLLFCWQRLEITLVNIKGGSVYNEVSAEHLRKYFDDGFECDLNSLKNSVLQLVSNDKNNYEIGNEIDYPNNVLRNIALSKVATEHVMVLDIDLLPLNNLYFTFSYALQNIIKETRIATNGSLKGSYNNSTLYLPFAMDGKPIDNDFVPMEKVLVVVPVYEISNKSVVPQTKQALLDLIRVGAARPFYQKICPLCQSPSDYGRWEVSSLPYRVPWQHPYEPFYIASLSQLPSYDERFRQFGYNRISQLCESHLAGFQLVVLPWGFLTHNGFKESLHAKASIELQRNIELYDEFVEEKYKEYDAELTGRRCM